MKKNRFLLFAGYADDKFMAYGFGGFCGAFETIDDAKREQPEDAPPGFGFCGGEDWGHIVDTESMKIVLKWIPQNRNSAGEWLEVQP